MIPSLREGGRRAGGVDDGLLCNEVQHRVLLNMASLFWSFVECRSLGCRYALSW